MLRVRWTYAYLRDTAAAKWIWIQKPATMSYDLIYSDIFDSSFSAGICWDRCVQIERWQLVACESFVIWRDTASYTQWHSACAAHSVQWYTFEEVQGTTEFPLLLLSLSFIIICMGVMHWRFESHGKCNESIHQSGATLFNCIHFRWMCVLGRWVERPPYPCQKRSYCNARLGYLCHVRITVQTYSMPDSR